ncbi:2,3-bisphosphoglycerate-independent phosphoglycerate mutase [Halieaceae bacterium IMCC14734]|uniref:2,3-bisphosphoglycerate-independent phosphoglycerate mutase n=1 Tax=Candidatus Litorirhabdus singularis TaxID=2518993 RepID=A0ABT3TDD7_9GAMM|nr:2,3-bisphosphoglycerate-independent phosphoglycerate mutase [Candidatus Litorirhabdus singularis]MCX2979835.1 2,3-bisphosphoglycerate-independent phosphoglycerate mutase [Candidatus Litorirhabdus singularis]
MNDTSKHTVLLVILDGWGYREETRDNAIANANTPVWDRWWQQRPHTLLSGSGLDVGLPDGQMGNSEVGHMSLGAGRVVYQNMTRIDAAINDGSFNENTAYNSAIDQAIDNGGAVHIFGLLSEGGVHSHQRHIQAAIALAHQRGATKVYLHAFLDGRDTPPRSALPCIAAMESQFAELGCGRVASIIGRYYAMDRDNRWERVEQAWDLLTNGTAPYKAASASAGLEQAYQRGENDEFVKATIIAGSDETAATVEDGDCVLFMNFRADRARQLTRAFVEDGFTQFERKKQPKLADFVMTTEYAADLDASCAYPPSSLTNVLPDVLSQSGKTQLRIAETEKYAHVTFFFSGGREQEYAGETRILVPSPDVATYDLQPEMSAPELTDKLIAAVESQQYDLIVCNYANGDMVGHTGNYNAAMAAVEALDTCLGRLEKALLTSGSEALITADHGNCEQMIDYDSGQNHTQHTTELVPLVYVGNRDASFNGAPGVLADVAPSLLQLLKVPQPSEMTGKQLLTLA